MTFDVGRIRHDSVLMHYSRMSNGSAAPSNWALRATGDTGMAFAPDSGGSVSFGSNSNEVTFANAPGASTLASRADHVHRGVTSLAHASNTYTGPVTLETEGSLYIVRSAANTYRLGSTGGSGSVSYGSNSNEVSYVNAPGASPLASRADHVHRGVTTVSHTSNTFAGPVILTASGSLGITVPTPGTFNLSAVAGTSGGAAGPTDYVSGESATGHIVITDLVRSSPAAVRGLSLWLAADHLSGLSDGDPVVQWPNSAPGIMGLDAEAPVSPIYKTSIVNSKPIVRFDGSTQYFRMSLPPQVLGISIFVVFKLANITPAYAGLFGVSAAGDTGGWFIKSSGKSALYASGNVYDGSGSITYGTSAFNYSTMVIGRQTYTTRRNGSADASGAATFLPNWGVSAILANQAIGGRYMACDIAEFLMYYRGLTSSEITSVESYLSTKYAL